MVDEKITVPSILSINIIFLCITAGYLCIKAFMGQNIMLSAVYLIVILFTQYLYNMWIILGTHKTSDTTMALTSLIFWIIFVVLYIIINMGFTSWKIPFSNTIGYAVANMIHPISTKFKDILKDGSSPPFVGEIPIDVHTPSHKDDNTLLLSIRNMRSDPHFVLTKATYENHRPFLDKLKANKVFKDDPTAVDEAFESIKQWYLYKDIVAEGVWLALAGSLTIAVTYYYIVSAPIASSPEAIAKSDANLRTSEDETLKGPSFVNSSSMLSASNND
jgi:hypothetical protein